MRLLLIIFIAILFNQNVFTQSNVGYVVKAGQVPNKVIPVQAMYVSPVFKSGVVNLRNGTASRQLLNYNIILDEMQFIGSKGDTLTIAEPEMVKSVAFDSFVYYYDKDYLQEIAKVDSFKLAIKQFFVQTPYKTGAGYGTTSGASAIATYTSIGIGNRPRANLQVDKDVAFHKLAGFFISDRFNHFFKADKKTFLNLFPERKNGIEKYIKDNKVNFLKPEDLVKLLEFSTRD